MASEYLIQVVHKDTGKVIAWAPGLEAEKEFVTELCGRVGRKPVGLLRTVKQVEVAVKEAVEEMLYDLKSRV